MSRLLSLYLSLLYNMKGKKLVFFYHIYDLFAESSLAKRGEEMNPYIITLIGMAILSPVIYIVPSNLSRQGKLVLLLASFIIAEMGVLALNVFPYWQAGGLLLLLIVLASYLLHNRAGIIFIDSAENEYAAAKQLPDEPKQDDLKESTQSDHRPEEDEILMKEGISEAGQHEFPEIQSVEQESGIDSFGISILKEESEKIDGTDTVPEESDKLEGADIVLEESDKLERAVMDPEESRELDDLDLPIGSIVETDDFTMVSEDNTEIVLDGPIEADGTEYVEESKDELFKESTEESMWMPEIYDEQSGTLPEDSEEQAGEESYLASIEKMLEEGNMDDLAPFNPRPEADDMTDTDQNELIEELESIAAGMAGASDDAEASLEETDSGIRGNLDNEEVVHEESEGLPASEEDAHIDGGTEEDELSSSAEGIPNSSQLQELNTLIIDSLKFAEFDMEPGSYITLLQNQLEKELPLQMHYEIALMLNKAYFKAGEYSKSRDLIEKMMSDYGHLPAVSLELEILYGNVKKLVR